MRDEFRDRFFTPFLLPVTVIGVMLLIGISLSRILLAVSEIGAAMVAFLAAGYIMAMAFAVEARRRITARALGVAMAIGLIGLIGAGAVASAGNGAVVILAQPAQARCWTRCSVATSRIGGRSKT